MNKTSKQQEHHRIKSRLLAALLVLVMALSLAACGKSEARRISTLTDTAMRNAIYDVLDIPRTGKDYPAAINEYLTNRGKEMGMEATVDKTGNLMMELPASTGNENRPLTILRCQTGMEMAIDASVLFDEDTDTIDPVYDEESGLIHGRGVSLGARSALGIATILQVLENAENHGPVRAIFTKGVDGESLTDSLDPAWLKGGMLIDLTGDKTGDIAIGSAYGAVLESQQVLTPAAVQNKQAYVLVATGFPADRPRLGTEKGVSPVKALADVLTAAVADGLMFELCSFESEGAPLKTPTEAIAVVAVGDYEQRRFRTIFDQTAEQYQKQVSDVADGAKIQMIETTVPAYALANTDTSRIITFLYGLLDADFSGKMAVPTAVNLGAVKISPTAFQCRLSVLGEDEQAVKGIIADQSAIARLSEITLEKTGDIPGFLGSEKDKTIVRLADSYRNFWNKKVNFTTLPSASPLGGFAMAQPETPIVAIGATITKEGTPGEGLYLEDLALPADIILDFLTSPKTTQ